MCAGHIIICGLCVGSVFIAQRLIIRIILKVSCGAAVNYCLCIIKSLLRCIDSSLSVLNIRCAVSYRLACSFESSVLILLVLFRVSLCGFCLCNRCLLIGGLCLGCICCCLCVIGSLFRIVSCRHGTVQIRCLLSNSYICSILLVLGIGQSSVLLGNDLICLRLLRNSSVVVCGCEIQSCLCCLVLIGRGVRIGNCIVIRLLRGIHRILCDLHVLVCRLLVGCCRIVLSFCCVLCRLCRSCSILGTL